MQDVARVSGPQARWMVVGGVALAGMVLAILVGAWVWQAGIHRSDKAEMESHNTTAFLLQEAGKEAQVAAPLLRRYVETGDGALVPDIQSHATAAIKNLTAAVSQGGVADLTTIAAEGSRVSDGLGQIIALRQSGNVPAAAAALEQLSPAFEKVTAEVTAVVTLELQEASELQSSADKADSAASWLLIASIVWGAAMGVGVTALVARSMFGRRVSKTPSTI